MPLQVWFWVIFVIALVCYHFLLYDPAIPVGRRWGGGWIFFILVGILGWAVFGSAVK